MAESRPVLLVVRGEIARGGEKEFAAALVLLLQSIWHFPGLLELHGLQRLGAVSNFSVACRLANRKARQVFTASSPYRVWLRTVRRLSPVNHPFQRG